MINLRAIRTNRGLTMKELGKKVGLAESTIGKYETGDREPKFEVLLKLSEALDCTVFDILGENDQQMFLTREERRLVECWRMASDSDKKYVRFALREYGMPQPKEEDTTVPSASSAVS